MGAIGKVFRRLIGGMWEPLGQASRCMKQGGGGCPT